MWYLQQCRYHIFCIYLLEDEFEIRAAFFRFLENLRREYFSPHSPSVQILGVVFLFLFFSRKSISFISKAIRFRVFPLKVRQIIYLRPRVARIAAEGSANCGRR